MCGIFGYIGPDDPASICLQGLQHLEYRGYDSAGLCGTTAKRELVHWKEPGKIAVLKASWEQSKAPLTLAVGHTRWATHGEPTRENAHPHFDERGHVAVVHNGIVENHALLREMLTSRGVKFSSQTDTEVIAQLIAYFYKGDLVAATHEALALMQGFWAIGVVHKDHPHEMVAAAQENPLAIGMREGEAFISSDVNAFCASDLDIVFLKGSEIASVQRAKMEVVDATRTPVKKTAEKITLDASVVSKGPFEHFMLKEIFEQPETLKQALHNRFIEDFGNAEFEHFQLTPHDLQSTQRVLILACGTSWHAGLIAASMIEEKARIPCQVEIASEFRYKNPIVSDNTLVIAISQSGETLDTIAAVREVQQKGSKVLAICNVRNSTLTREADATIFLRAGPEISVCSTKAFTSQITVLALFALLLGRQRHLDKEAGQKFLADLRSLPHLAEEVLSLHATIQAIAEHYAEYTNFFFLGRHYMFPTSLEAALKLKEISYLNATAYPAGELKHGPISLIDASLPVIGLAGNLKTVEKMTSNLREAKARGAPILAFTFPGSLEIQSIATHSVILPNCPDELAPVLFSIALQLFAYYVALCRTGTNIDQPRNLAKCVTVE